MCPGRLSFLTKFDKFYQELINLAKEDKINEKECAKKRICKEILNEDQEIFN